MTDKTNSDVTLTLNMYDEHPDVMNVLDTTTMTVSEAAVSDIVDHAVHLILSIREHGKVMPEMDGLIGELDEALSACGVIDREPAPEHPSADSVPTPPVIVQFGFDIVSGEAHQVVELLDDTYDETSIIQGLRNGTLLTTTGHEDGSASYIEVLGTWHKVGRICSQDISGEYDDFRYR